MRTKPTLAIVVPCFNEEEVLPYTLPRFLAKLGELIRNNQVAEDSFLMLADDGSSDSTWDIICTLARHNSRVRGIRQSRNRGHQNTVLAGLMEVKDCCDASISIDCDGQDDVDAMDEMISRYREGFDVVYGVRGNRRTDAWFKRTTARAFYRLLGWLGAEVVYDHADYRLLSAPVMKELSGFREVNIYLRGMVPLVGFKSCEVVYLCRKFLRHRVGGGECCDGVGCIRLGEYDQRDMPFGRRPAHMPRCHRGICRQDLSRDQGTPALHHLRAHELRR